MLPDEQTYPIEKTTDTENVWALSALQISVLLRAADHEALFAAATDYTATAEQLDRTADTIRRGATNLATAWRGHAARDSLNHLRQYYASARALAADCRTSAVAMEHAARALAEARARAALLPGDTFAGADPTSVQSFEYQKVLSDLNAAYREAITMAPDQLAISLPSSESVTRSDDQWINLGHGPKGAPSGRASHDPYGISGGLRRPSMLPPEVPPNGHRGPWHVQEEPRSNHPRNTDDGRHGDN